MSLVLKIPTIREEKTTNGGRESGRRYSLIYRGTRGGRLFRIYRNRITERFKRSQEENFQFEKRSGLMFY